MSDYLNSLAVRTLGAAPLVQPRLPSLFESGPPGTHTEVSVETQARRNESRKPALFTPSAPSAEPMVVEVRTVMNYKSEALVGEKESRPAGAETSREDPLTRVANSTPPLAPTPERSAQNQNQPATLTIYEKAQPNLLPSETGSEPVPSAQEANREETWPQLKPKIQQFFDERLSHLQPTSPRKDDRTNSEQAITVAETVVHRSDEPKEPLVVKPTPHVVRVPLALPEPPPAVTVTIGRIDVRAIFSQPGQQPRRVAREQAKTTSLDEYLARRSEGRR